MSSQSKTGTAGRGAPRVISDGPRPKHAQLTDALTELVTQDLGPDAAIPSERDLMTTYDVSRATVRKAIDTLVVNGLLQRIQGKGTFVARPRLESRLHLASFSQDMLRRGLTPSTVLLGIEADTPPAEVAAALENGWYPQRPLPGLDRQDLSGSLYQVFERTYGFSIDTAEQTLWGETAEGAVAHRLDAPEHTPLLVFRRVSRAGSLPLEHVVSRYRGDRYQIHMSLGRDGIGPVSTTTEGNDQ